MKHLLIFFHFYKTYIAWSFIITILLGFVDSHYISAVLTKLFLTIFAWYITNETSNKHKLTFYKNLGISIRTLFISMFVVDSVLTILIIFLFKI
jgi:hypothetical protein